MAAFTVHTAKHATLGIATVDSVVLDVYGKSIQIVHRGAAANPIYVTIGNIASVAAVAGVPGTPDPVSAADDNYVVVAGTAGNPLVVQWPATAMGNIGGIKQTACVKLICAAAEPYSVQVINEYGG